MDLPKREHESAIDSNGFLRCVESSYFLIVHPRGGRRAANPCNRRTAGHVAACSGVLEQKNPCLGYQGQFVEMTGNR